MFEKHGLFRTDLGPSPDRNIPRPNEDTEFGRRLMAAGEHLRYEPSAIAYHPVLENRIQNATFCRGISITVSDGSRMETWADILGISRRCLSFLNLPALFSHG